MSRVVSMDPGMNTGIIEADIEDDSLPKIARKHQILGGLGAVMEWQGGLGCYLHEARFVCEKWHPRPGARTYKLDELEPLRIEGYIEATHGDHLLFRQPEQRHLFKESDAFEKSAAFLKWAGYWSTGSEFGYKDANDANSAMMHLFSYLRSMKHRPTISLLLDYNRSIAME